jgi:hypothetical protein
MSGESQASARPSGVVVTGLPRGTVLRLERVDLPAVRDHVGVNDGTRLAMERRRRDNVARQCWRLVYPDGTPVNAGLFVGVGFAEEYANEHGWIVLHETA